MASDPWPVHETATTFECPWFTVGYDAVERPNGETARYFWVEPADSVAVVAVTDGEVVLVEQYRPRHGERFVSCPVGAVEAGESFAAAGARELREETGYSAGRVDHLETYYGAGWLRQERGVVFADDLTPGDQDLDDGEFVDVHTVPVDEALELARDGPTNGWTLTPLLLADHEGLL
ncbi:NUDIX hydrolase [Halobacteriales archaeon Cl-PHB]